MLLAVFWSIAQIVISGSIHDPLGKLVRIGWAWAAS